MTDPRIQSMDLDNLGDNRPRPFMSAPNLGNTFKAVAPVVDAVVTDPTQGTKNMFQVIPSNTAAETPNSPSSGGNVQKTSIGGWNPFNP